MINQPHIFVLSLSDCVERRAPLLKQLQGFGLRYEVWDAIDGRHGLPAEYEVDIDRAASRRRLQRDMSDPEFACALSHRAIQQDIISRNLQGALILEDDAVLAEDFPDILPHLNGPTHDLVLLYHNGGYARQQTISLTDRYTAQRVTQHPDCNAAYYVTRKGAAQLVRAATAVSYVADWPTDLSRMNAFAIMPRPVLAPVADPTQSDIELSRRQMKRNQENKNKRFLRASYWRRKWIRLTSVRLL